ncbi:MAG: hypothetical protein NTU63_01015 [Candidatus Pacearchaeota archaeon]|nr:hypothetical protein [Candidatus Pacearchaeota archaeon]
MKKLKSKGNKIAVVVGLFTAIMHAMWALLVALGLGQTFMDWILPLHFIDSLYSVMPFSFLTALFLIVVAFVSGYLATLLFIALWKAMKIK